MNSTNRRMLMFRPEKADDVIRLLINILHASLKSVERELDKGDHPLDNPNDQTNRITRPQLEDLKLVFDEAIGTAKTTHSRITRAISVIALTRS